MKWLKPYLPFSRKGEAPFNVRLCREMLYPRESPFARCEFKKILIRGVNWIGDTIITFPAIWGIRQAFPEAHLAVMVIPYLTSLFEKSKMVDEVISCPQARRARLISEESSCVHRLRKEQFDLAIILPRSFRSALVPFLARIPIRLGYRTCMRGVLLTHSLRETEERLSCHQAEYYYHLSRLLGAPPEWMPPELEVGEEERRWADSFLKERGIKENHLLVGINPGSTYGGAKCWLPERYLELARRLIARYPVTFILVGGEDNRPLIHSLAASLGGRGIEVIGQHLLHLAALIRRCQLFITNDTGPMHMAAAVKTPVVALFGSTNPVATSPLGEGHCVVRKKVSCSPCLKRECPEDHRCMTLITVDEVEKVVVERLERLPASFP